jgi:hypothetical protein
MKWILKVLYSVLCLLLLSGCTCLKKISTTTTETITKIDTIIRYLPDTTKHVVSVPIMDTASIVTPEATARSYFNVATQRIELSLKLRPFDVPVVFNRVEIKKEVIKEPVKKFPWRCYIVFIPMIIIIILLYKKIK